ncbi:MAG: ATP synthase F1 subunit delta [Bacteroidetes bacterium]|nr:MAG: ATP synthase F1 subunit delta [Bacteroidota bacterium]
MPNLRLAGRYAKSLIDLAIEKKELDPVYDDMLFLQAICKKNRDFVSMLKSPVINADMKHKIVDAITKDKVNVITSSFIRLLITKGRESYLPEIISAFVQQYKDYMGIHVVKLTTAAPVSEDLKKVVVSKIKSVAGLKDVELQTEVKEDIIGGFILEFGDRMVDASVAYELNNARKQFESNDFIYQIR